MMRTVSITRRLILGVLILELLAAVVLIAAITIHERHVQLQSFDTTLKATAESLMGAVQDSGDEGVNVFLDMRGIQLGKDTVFRVEDDRGRVLGGFGTPPQFEVSPKDAVFRNIKVNDRELRFLFFRGVRIVDAGEPGGGVRHYVRIVYGAPLGHVWHEVREATRFFAIATAILLGFTAISLAWLVRTSLSPLYELARKAELISSSDWAFDAPESVRRTVELRPLAAALEAALARLRRTFDQQRRFTSDAAHELKTDVAIVKSSLQLLSMRKRTVEEYGRGLALSVDDFTRLETTVQKMLTLARLEQPKESDTSSAVLQTCSVCDVMEEAVHQSRPFAQLKALEICVQCGSDARVVIDTRDAFLLCSNILVNALQHSPNGARVEVTVTTDQEFVLVSVRDHGEGITNEDLPFIFEAFYRGDQSRSRKSGGTGLGLSICKAICDRVGGSIQLSNHAGGGALVTVSLPMQAVVPKPALSASLKAQPLH